VRSKPSAKTWSSSAIKIRMVLSPQVIGDFRRSSLAQRLLTLHRQFNLVCQP
jgi:hypothetical protein